MIEWRISPRKLAKQFIDVLFVAGVFAGVTRGQNSGRTAQRIDFETGIVRDDQQMSILYSSILRGRHCFKDRVLFKCSTAFFRNCHFVKKAEIVHIEIFAQQLAKLARLICIAGGQEQRLHWNKL